MYSYIIKEMINIYSLEKYEIYLDDTHNPLIVDYLVVILILLFMKQNIIIKVIIYNLDLINYTLFLVI